MPRITVLCDRCKKEVSGLVVDGYTAGFYQVEGTIWHKYANEGEKIVCDACMWKDPRYLKDYPPVAVKKEDVEDLLTP